MSTTPTRASRLPLLLVVLAAVGLIRWWDPIERLSAKDAMAIAEAVVRPNAAGAPAALPTAPVPRSSSVALGAGDFHAGTRLPPEGEQRNAFAPRLPPVLPPSPAVPPVPRVAAVIVAPSPPAPPPAPPVDTGPPPPALQVIGTWRDDRGLSVFVAGPQGVVMARTGDTLLSQYTVTQVLPQQLVLKHVPSNRDLSLPIPVAAATPARPLP